MSFDSQKVSSFLKRAAVIAVGVAAVFAAGEVVAAPQCIYVSQSGSGTAPYDEPGKATSSIETAVAAVTGDEAIIYVAPSTTPYKFTGTSRLNIRSNVKIWGQTDDPTQVVIEPKTAKASPLFLLGHADAGLYSLTLQGASKGGLKGGACVKIESTGGTVSNCVMRNVYDDGSWDATAAGVYMDAGLVTHCVLTNIYASMGSSQSHGMVAYMAGGSMENCLVAQNPLGGKDSSSASGGVVALAGSSRLVNCTIAGNRMRGPAGVLIESTTAEVINCVIADNTSTQQPGTETYVGYTSGNKAINVKDCFTACVTKEDINGTCYQTDVFFKNAAAHDYHLAFNSPAVDHGVTPENYTPPATDLDRNARIVNGMIDIGCYEYFSSGLECSFVMSAAKGMVPYEVTFTAAVSDPNPNSLTYKWDVFGDGSVIETTQTPTLVYTYTVGGTFITKLTVVKGGVDYPANNTVSFKAYPKDVYVSQSGTGTSPYDEPGKATSSIEDAVAVASDGSVIHVAASATPYKFTKAERLSIRENIVIRGPEGDPTQVVFEPKSAKASPLFLLGHADAGLYNLTMQGGCGGGASADSMPAGDCVYIEKTGGTVSNCVMRNVSNSCRYGVYAAGVHMAAGLVTHCVLSNLVSAMNSSSSQGMSVSLSGGSMENCLITQNIGTGKTDPPSSGGIVLLSGDSRLVNCTIAGNKLNGPAGILVGSTTAKVINCVIGDNTSVLYPGTAVETYAGYSGKTAINVTNCFTACATEIYINDTCYVGDLAFKDRAAHDYHITVDSPARNHGVIPDGYMPPATDLDGKPRIVSRKIDIGCYECKGGGFTLIVR